MRIRDLSPRIWLAIGWLGFMLYAFPGYMSFDSVFQLREARAGVFTEGHPPLMAVLWRVVECVIAGPFGMLVIQSVCFLGGTYLLLQRWMSRRTAALAAVLVLWFPVTATTMAVIWKDSQMAGFLVLGTALLLDERRNRRLLGIAAIWGATAMRHNAFAMTFPIVLLLFVWNPEWRWWKRYALSFVTWLAITGSVQVTNRALVETHAYLWHEGMALFDIVSTARFVPSASDSDLERALQGTPVKHPETVLAKVRAPVDEWNFAASMWAITYDVFNTPRTQAERDAVAAAWKTIVAGHPWAYAAYRWHVFRQILQLVDVPEEMRSSPIYIWYVDVQNVEHSAASVEHNAAPSRIQSTLREAMWEIGKTSLFRTYVYVLLSLLLVAFCFRDRALLAIVASGLTGEAALYILAPITDWRYSFWLVVSTLIVTFATIAKRSRRATQPAS